MRSYIVLILAGSLAAAAYAERQPYERYQSIVDRQMFGPLPPGFDPTKSPAEVAKTKPKAEQELTKEQEQVKKAIRFSVMNVSAAGETYVGFTDNGDPKLPVHYYLKVGESQNGWTVKEADAETSSMTIENKDGIEVTLKLGGDSSSDAAAVSRAGAAPAAAPARAMPKGGGAAMFGGLKGRREQRRLREAQLEADAAKRAEEDKARAAREAEEKQQREAEREEQRKQLQQIQEELRKAREARESSKDGDKSSGDE